MEIIDVNLFYSLIPMLFTLILIEALFRDQFKTRQVITLVRWFLIFYFVIGLVYYLIGLLRFPNEYAIINRASGPYAWAFWIMFIAAAALPFSLFYKKLAMNPFYLIFLVFMMKIGYYFERFVIMVTSFHTDYSPNNSNDFHWLNFWIISVLLQILKGFIIAIILLGIFELMARRKKIYKGG